MLYRALSCYGKSEKFGGHEESVRVCLGESNSSYLSVLQTSQEHNNSIVQYKPIVLTLPVEMCSKTRPTTRARKKYIAKRIT